ncbi:MAG: type II toxin-antitoxin system RelE/ParE family toxin [Acidobacteriota bacterium]|nr:type II toxin-antitoxin system RelE/ParE family toxin [Acidobacteriota bacterium]
MEKPLYSFRETPSFSKRIVALLTDEELANFQWLLVQTPETGDLIQGGGGIRKIRCAAKGKGKRGGARVIYYLAIGAEKIFLLDVYAKTEKSDLTSSELQNLRKIVEEWLQQ